MKVYHLSSECKHIKTIGPVSYLDMLQLEKNAKAILTDSGGVQKEAYWLRVRCFTLREETEWLETVGSGWNILVGSDKEKIVEEVTRFRKKGSLRMKSASFGNGRAGDRICQIIRNHFCM
jgi:UDP-N-acetylglucosamine 2-epimerase (non-hydrolysing)